MLSIQISYTQVPQERLPNTIDRVHPNRNTRHAHSTQYSSNSLRRQTTNTCIHGHTNLYSTVRSGSIPSHNNYLSYYSKLVKGITSPKIPADFSLLFEKTRVHFLKKCLLYIPSSTAVEKRKAVE